MSSLSSCNVSDVPSRKWLRFPLFQQKSTHITMFLFSFFLVSGLSLPWHMTFCEWCSSKPSYFGSQLVSQSFTTEAKQSVVRKKCEISLLTRPIKSRARRNLNLLCNIFDDGSLFLLRSRFTRLLLCLVHVTAILFGKTNSSLFNCCTVSDDSRR